MLRAWRYGVEKAWRRHTMNAPQQIEVSAAAKEGHHGVAHQHLIGCAHCCTSSTSFRAYSRAFALKPLIKQQRTRVVKKKPHPLAAPP